LKSGYDNLRCLTTVRLDPTRRAQHITQPLPDPDYYASEAGAPKRKIKEIQAGTTTQSDGGCLVRGKAHSGGKANNKVTLEKNYLTSGGPHSWTFSMPLFLGLYDGETGVSSILD